MPKKLSEEELSVFGQRLQESIDAYAESGFNQEALAQRLGVHSQTITQWKKGERFPKMDQILEMCQIFRLKSADWLMGITDIRQIDLSSNSQIEEFENIKWIRQEPTNLSPQLLEDAHLGAKLFEFSLDSDMDKNDIPRKGPKKFQNKGQEELDRLLSLAFKSGYIRIVGVEPNEDLETEISNNYPDLWNIHVAALPKRLPTLVQVELITTMAAKQIDPGRIMGLGWGYTVGRFANLLQTPPEICVSLCAMRDENIELWGYSSNCAVATVSNRFPLTQGSYLQYISAEERAAISSANTSSAVQVTNHLSRTGNMSCVVLSVNSLQTTRSRNPARTADYVLEYAAARAMVDNIPEEDCKFACIVLGWLIERDGALAQINPNEHFSIDLETLKKRAKATPVWLIAARYYKAGSVHTAIKHQFANSLVIDAELATKLVEISRQN